MALRRVTLTSPVGAGARDLTRGRGTGKGRGRGSRDSDSHATWQKPSWTTRSEGSSWRTDSARRSWPEKSWNNKWDDSGAKQTPDRSRGPRGAGTASDRKDESPGRAPKVVLRPAAGASRGADRSVEASSSRLSEKDGVSRVGGIVLEENRNAKRRPVSNGPPSPALQAVRAMRDAKRASLGRAVVRKPNLSEVGARQRLSVRGNEKEVAAEVARQLSSRSSKSLAIEEQPGHRRGSTVGAARRLLGHRVARAPPRSLQPRRTGQSTPPVAEADVEEERQELEIDDAPQVESDHGKATSSRSQLNRPPSEEVEDVEPARKSGGETADVQQPQKARVWLRRSVLAKPNQKNEADERVSKKPVLKAATRTGTGQRRVVGRGVAAKKMPVRPLRIGGNAQMLLANAVRQATGQEPQRTPRKTGPVNTFGRSAGPRNSLGKQFDAVAVDAGSEEEDLDEKPGKLIDDEIDAQIEKLQDRDAEDEPHRNNIDASSSQREPPQPPHRRRKILEQADGAPRRNARGAELRRRKANLKRRSPLALDGPAKRRRTSPNEQLEEKKDLAEIVDDDGDDAQPQSRHIRDATDRHSRHVKVAAEEDILPHRTVQVITRDPDQGKLDEDKYDRFDSGRADDDSQAPPRSKSKVDDADDKLKDDGDAIFDGPYMAGDRVEFWSTTHKCYTRTRVLEVNSNGDVLLSCKKKAWILKTDHAGLIRPIGSAKERLSKGTAPQERGQEDRSPDACSRRHSGEIVKRESSPYLASIKRDPRRSPCQSERRKSASHSATRSRSANRREAADKRLSQTGESPQAEEPEQQEEIVEEASPRQPPVVEEAVSEDRAEERVEPEPISAQETKVEVKKREDDSETSRKVGALAALASSDSVSQMKKKVEAEPEPNVDSGSQNVAAGEHIYEAGERVEFWSQTHKQWTRTTIKDKRVDGEVLLACKSAWISKAEQAAKMRPIQVQPPAAPPKGARAKAAPAASQAVPNSDNSAKEVAAPGDDKDRHRSPSEDSRKKRVAEAAMAIFASVKGPADQKRCSSSSSSSSTHSVAPSASEAKEGKQGGEKESKVVAETSHSKADRLGQGKRASEERRSPPKRGLSLELDDDVLKDSQDKQRGRKQKDDADADEDKRRGSRHKNDERKEEEFNEEEAQPRPKSSAHGKSQRGRRQESSERRESSPKHDKAGVEEDDGQPKPKSGAHKRHRRRKDNSDAKDDSPKRDKNKVDDEKKKNSPERVAKRENSSGRDRKDSSQVESSKRSKRDRSGRKDSSEPRERKTSLELSEKKREPSKRRSPANRGRKDSPDRSRRASPERKKKDGSPERKKKDDSPERKKKDDSPERKKKGSRDRGRRDGREDDKDKADRRGDGSPRKNSGSARHRESDDRDRKDSGGHDRSRGQDNRGRGQRDEGKSSGRRDRSPYGRTGSRGGDPGSGRRGRSRDAKPAEGKRNRSRSDRKPRHRDRSRR